MRLKSILIVGLLGLSLAACGNNNSADADSAAASAEPSAFQQKLDATIAACHVAVAATEDWQKLDSSEIYKIARDAIKENPDAITAEGGGFNPRNLAATHCARNMSQYANGGEKPQGLAD